MSKEELSVSAVVGEIYQSVLASPKRQRRLLSKTFWGRFGFKARTKERIEQVRTALMQQGLIINLDDATFGIESKDEWVVLSYVEPTLTATSLKQGNSSVKPAETITPSDDWFNLMASRKFESEREVEYYFIVPLLESLGYSEDDLAIGYPVDIYEGVTRVKKEADLVIFNGSNHRKENALLVVEAKKSDKLLTVDAVGQAKGYAVWLTTPYYLVTNAEEIQLYLFRAGLHPDVPLAKFSRSELRQHWAMLYQHINKAAVIERKDKLGKILAANGV